MTRFELARKTLTFLAFISIVELWHIERKTEDFKPHRQVIRKKSSDRKAIAAMNSIIDVNSE